ncbi:MAG: methyl-accepting chemotaxis protein [Terracidiphilus sp.]|jgi:methyl-accepting chemotaxis protein
MNWFRNLNAMPRLMISFGVLIAIAMGLSYLGITRLADANESLATMYQKHMLGAIQANDMEIARFSIGRMERDAMLNPDNPQIVDADEKTMQDNFAKFHAALDLADKTFVTREGQGYMAAIRNGLPAYEQANLAVIDLLRAHNIAGARAKLAEGVEYGRVLVENGEKAKALKESFAEKVFDDDSKAYRQTRTLMILAALSALALGIGMAFGIARGFSVPLGHAVMVLQTLADGDLTIRSAVKTKDEVGRMAEALNRALEKLEFTMQEVADSAAHASSSSQELAAAAEAIASGAQEQAASLEETSASLEEITATVRQTADNAKQASQLAAGSKDSALQGQDVVSNAITAMAEINAASAKISDIISTIDEIAFQTNLLAVNAAVEAARAGDEGRGFAVVASEVRSLAQRSAVAAKEIKVLIQDSLRKVDAGSGLVNRSGETLLGIVGSVKRVTDIVGEIAAASGEQSTGIEQVNTAMTQMDQVTQSNSAQTEELSATAQALSEQAAHLLELVSTFTLSQGGKNAGEHQTFQSHEAIPAHSVGASLVRSVKSHLVHPPLHAGSANHLNQPGHRPSKAARSTASAKPNPRLRSAKAVNEGQAALAIATAAAPGGAGASDASFEEF